MRKDFLICAGIILIIVSLAVTVSSNALNDSKQESTVTALAAEKTTLYYGDDTLENALTYPFVDWGHAVLFTPPTKPWTLEKVDIVGGYINNSGDIIFALEIWDKDYTLLYKLTDYSQAYFEIAPSFTWTEIDIPDIEVTDDFYVCLFERGSIYVGADANNPAMRSYMVLRSPKGMINATYRESEDVPDKPFNWMIRAIGS